MPTQLTQALPAFAFSRNEILAIIASDDVVDTAGVQAIWKLSVAGVPATGTQLRITWTFADLTFVASTDPDTSGLQFLKTATVAQLADFFSKNYYVARDFDVSYAGSDVFFTAKKAGIDYNFRPVSASTLTLAQQNAGVTEVKKANFRHFLRVLLSDQEVYSRSLALDNGTTITTKDISDILHPYMGSDRPDLAALTWSACAETLKPYKIQVAAYYGDNPTVKQLYETPVSWVNRGGLSVQSAPGQTLQQWLRPGNVNESCRCLRQGSKTTLVQPDQPEWLYWLNLTGADVNVRLRVEIFTDDGNSNYYFIPGVAVPANSKYYVPTGFNFLNIRASMPSGRLCKYYQVRIADNAGNYLSDNYTYVMDNYREFARYFVYLNSLGGYQTLYTYGKAEYETTRTKQDISRQVTELEAARSGRAKEVNIRLQDTITQNTGYFTNREISLLKDFMASEERYLVSNGQLVPIGISSDSLKLPKDGEYLNGASFIFFPLYDEKVYTDLPDQADAIVTGGGPGVASGYDMLEDDGNNDDDKYYDDI